ncbi:MAG: acetate kinase, partial [Lachnospiraceae bacterium]|nr:acetate kinase [Lachnospiraceae bacterium]
MNILVINCGSSSLKFQLIDSETEKQIAKGLCERIGIEGSQLVYQPAGGEKEETVTPMPDHTKAIELVLNALTNEKTGVVKSLDEIGAVGHRIVHGGEKFAASTIITDEVIEAITACNDLAPLHNPANLIGIDACRKLMPNTPMVGVFDTAFHQTMPKEAYLYGLPYEYYEKYQVRRYGFHGTSHSYVSKRAAELLGKNYEDLKIIVCHLGNGASISAVKNGKCVDTSMGLTPLEGLIMGTRSGDIDPAIIEYIAHKENKSIDEVMTVMNKKSGVLVLSDNKSSDFRDLEK